ncbi:MAG: M28 family peptidase [Planctomycetes bacterium]|nr:M28 family peptidase [Planctomycetota bacterium]
MEVVSPEKLQDHLGHLCLEIGVRLAGSDAERRAAEYAEAALRDAGAPDVRVETFAVRRRAVGEERLDVDGSGGWQPFSCSLFSSTPGTGGEAVEAPLVFFEAPAEYAREDLSHLRGKAVVHLGCHIESRRQYRRLIEAAPAFLLLVDVRYPASTPRADGMFPSYTSDVGAVPSVNVAFQDAWRWKVEGAARARLRVAGGMRSGESQNVIAELPGDSARSGVLFLGAHHDTQADSVGADDNATGVAGLLELARVLAPLPRRRTIRLVSFGAEEQLSVGSARYVREHRAELAVRGRLIFNLDSFGSWMGWNDLVVNGTRELEECWRAAFESRGEFVRIARSIVPYADHFPFVAAGVPGLTLMRSNCTAGRFFHHRPDDDLSRVSTARMASLLDAVAERMADLAARPDLPFEPRVPLECAREVESFWIDLFGGWE